ncbi:hypothetical protein C0Q70_05718 [Pomacea canaliculata]|uniref:Uncharacterized protein n=1 Tax=Pomacea canaliculata TaxID=400727 RepID=A0A2T7PLZ1_POMCA|nr:hypothetical protein C0Q70_05718 [Pomacea canaliculata]
MYFNLSGKTDTLTHSQPHINLVSLFPRLTHPRHLSPLDFCFLPVILGSYRFPPPLKYAPLAAFLMSACRWLVFDLYEPERPRMRRRIYTHPVTSPLAVCACLVLLPYLTAHRCSPKLDKQTPTHFLYNCSLAESIHRAPESSTHVRLEEQPPEYRATTTRGLAVVSSGVLM